MNKIIIVRKDDEGESEWYNGVHVFTNATQFAKAYGISYGKVRYAIITNQNYVQGYEFIIKETNDSK